MYNLPGNDRPDIDLNKWENRPSEPSFGYRRERPLGVSLIAIWHFVGAGLSLLLAFLSLSLAGDSSAGGLASVVGCILLVIVPIDIAIGFGLWQLKSWARTSTIVFAIISLVLNVLDSEISGGDVLSIGLNLASVIYLFQPAVRDLFASPYG